IPLDGETPIHYGRPSMEEILEGIPDEWKDKPGIEDSIRFVNQFVSMIASMFLLAQESLGEVRRVVAPRASRKRAMRYEWENRTYISVITLRRKSMPSGKEPSQVEWSHRWMVTGHWRKQWYPSMGIHQWKYIAEYVKGPEDKPIVRRERRVFNFKR
ncbi:MAG TPA: hypothetical protein VFV92_08825, partial [Candidatus Bathyarchaeia archaeon]|nr:hypothetical protein [Candidatus Bathyarchaeia archaeon]